MKGAMQPDKLLHLAAGSAAAVLTTALVALLAVRIVEATGIVVSLALWAGALAPLLLGWAKERYDKTRHERHTYDGWDAFATAAGVLAAPLGLGLAALVTPFIPM